MVGRKGQVHDQGDETRVKGEPLHCAEQQEVRPEEARGRRRDSVQVLHQLCGAAQYYL